MGRLTHLMGFSANVDAYKGKQRLDSSIHFKQEFTGFLVSYDWWCLRWSWLPCQSRSKNASGIVISPMRLNSFSQTPVGRSPRANVTLLLFHNTYCQHRCLCPSLSSVVRVIRYLGRVEDSSQGTSFVGSMKSKWPKRYLWTIPPAPSDEWSP
jgi:hypothetical protein